MTGTAPYSARRCIECGATCDSDGRCPAELRDGRILNIAFAVALVFIFVMAWWLS